MQGNFVTFEPVSEKRMYHDSMPAGGRPAKTPRTELGERIAAAREKVGLSQIELADRMGVSQQVVAAWERKSKALRSDTLTKLSKLLKVSTDELLGLNPPRSSGKPRGKAGRILEEVGQLPRARQQHILRVVEELLAAQKLSS